jgi:hypothetical protein
MLSHGVRHLGRAACYAWRLANYLTPEAQLGYRNRNTGTFRPGLPKP